MAPPRKTETVPKAMQQIFDRIVTLTDEFAQAHLNAEYAQQIRYLVAALCRKRPSPLASGQAKTWACGASHAIGMVNFLFDSTQVPHISAKELYKWFGVSASTGQAKSKQIRDLLKMHQMDPGWYLPSKMDDNPIAWMITVDGFIIDARSAPPHIQQIAYEKGLIPYLPGEASPPSEQATLPKSKKTSKKTNQNTAKASPDKLFVLEVYIISGPVTEAFIEANPELSRRIELKGSSTLQDLHRIIFTAFDREEEHMYEFQIGGNGPMDPNARRYSIQSPSGNVSSNEEDVEDVATTTIADLGLSVEENFGYWFDFGDDWWHQIQVLKIKDKVPKGKYPKITQRVGASPPQYPDFDDE